MNRRGAELTDNVLSIIIAVIIIAAFIFAAYKLFSVYSNQETKNAQNAIDVIKAKADAVQEGQSGTFLLQGFQQSDIWTLAGWSRGAATTGNSAAPPKCNYQSCLCICPRKGLLVDDCQANGFCRVLGSDISKVIVSSKFEAPSLNLQMSDQPVQVTSTHDNDFIQLESGKTIELNLTRQKDEIILSKTK